MPKTSSNGGAGAGGSSRRNSSSSTAAASTSSGKTGKKATANKKSTGGNKNVKMQSIVPTSGHGLTAQRFAGKPLRQPGYSFRDVPRCNRDLSASALYEVTRRDDFNDSMAEMVLLCNEVMRRQADREADQAKKEGRPTGQVKRTAKPLSLEYIADRMDVDDPISGFFVRTAKPGVVASVVDVASAAPAAAAAAATSTSNGAVACSAAAPVSNGGIPNGDLKPAAVDNAAATPTAISQWIVDASAVV